MALYFALTPPRRPMTLVAEHPNLDTRGFRVVTLLYTRIQGSNYFEM